MIISTPVKIGVKRAELYWRDIIYWDEYDDKDKGVFDFKNKRDFR